MKLLKCHTLDDLLSYSTREEMDLIKNGEVLVEIAGKSQWACFYPKGLPGLNILFGRLGVLHTALNHHKYDHTLFINVDTYDFSLCYCTYCQWVDLTREIDLVRNASPDELERFGLVSPKEKKALFEKQDYWKF